MNRIHVTLYICKTFFFSVKKTFENELIVEESSCNVTLIDFK